MKFALNVSIIREGDSFVAYSPALDLSTVGDSLEEAHERFNEAVGIFFEEITKNETLDEVLLDLGWQKDGDKFTPPIVVSNNMEIFSLPNFAH